MKKAILLMGLAMGLFADQTAICEKVAINHVKPMMLDDSSFKKVKFDLNEKDGKKFGILTYKGTNVYGGVVTSMMFFYFETNNSECVITKAVSM